MLATIIAKSIHHWQCLYLLKRDFAALQQQSSRQTHRDSRVRCHMPLSQASLLRDIDCADRTASLPPALRYYTQCSALSTNLGRRKVARRADARERTDSLIVVSRLAEDIVFQNADVVNGITRRCIFHRSRTNCMAHPKMFGSPANPAERSPARTPGRTGPRSAGSAPTKRETIGGRRNCRNGPSGQRREPCAAATPAPASRGVPCGRSRRSTKAPFLRP